MPWFFQDYVWKYSLTIWLRCSNYVLGNFNWFLLSLPTSTPFHHHFEAHMYCMCKYQSMWAGREWSSALQLPTLTLPYSVTPAPLVCLMVGPSSQFPLCFAVLLVLVLVLDTKVQVLVYILQLVLFATFTHSHHILTLITPGHKLVYSEDRWTLNKEKYKTIIVFKTATVTIGSTT